MAGVGDAAAGIAVDRLAGGLRRGISERPDQAPKYAAESWTPTQLSSSWRPPLTRTTPATPYVRLRLRWEPSRQPTVITTGGRSRSVPDGCRGVVRLHQHRRVGHLADFEVGVAGLQASVDSGDLAVVRFSAPGAETLVFFPGAYEDC